MAASTRVIYDEASVGGKMLAEGVDFIRKGQEKLDRAKALADSVTAGGVTTSNLNGSTEFGASVVDGAGLYTAISDMKSNVHTVTDSALANLDKG